MRYLVLAVVLGGCVESEPIQDDGLYALTWECTGNCVAVPWSPPPNLTVANGVCRFAGESFPCGPSETSELFISGCADVPCTVTVYAETEIIDGEIRTVELVDRGMPVTALACNSTACATIKFSGR